MIVKYLYDLDSLIDIDSKGSHIIYSEDIIKVFAKSKPDLCAFIEQGVKDYPESGEVYLITNSYFTQKLYVLYIENAGKPWVKLLSYVDMDLGIDQSYALSKADYDVFKSYPMFQDDLDLAFFVAVQEYPTEAAASLNYQPDSNIISDAMNRMNLFLKEGLWMVVHNRSVSNSESANVLNVLGIDDLKPATDTKYQVGTYQEVPVMVNVSDKETTAYIIGPYETLKKLFLNNNNPQDLDPASRFSSYAFGAGYFYYDTEGIAAYPSDYKKEVGGTVTPSQNKVDIIENIVKNNPETQAKAEEIIIPVIEDAHKYMQEGKANFWDDTEKIFTEALKEEGVKKKKDRKKNFKIKTEISPAEVTIAAAEVAAEKSPKQVTLKTKKLKSLADTIQLAQKDAAILENPSFTYPHDWNYVYSLTECSNFYNLTQGHRFSRNTNKWETDEGQTKGMSIAEWNAYFIAHPELAHLIDPILGQFGGIVFTEQQLIESGDLLFNPVTNKLEYSYEYLKGNAYNLLENLEGAKDTVSQLYGSDFYNRQVSRIEAAMPAPKSIDEPNPSRVPFIHPLDEVVVKFELNTAANKTYPKSLNRRIMTAANESITKDPNSNVDIEAIGQELQSLSIIIFFTEWLETQYGKLAGYNLPDITIVNDVYFKGMSFGRFVEDFHKYKYHFDTTVTESDFFEVKDNVKRFVNDLFQDFLRTQITADDRAKIDKEWNKTYNGFIQINIHKHPIFIRHSKYFKDRDKARLLQLTESQIEGIKFATINNGSIMALEVGFGKTLVSIGYMSHCFETNQANNILTLVPKSLYVNKKWKEEISGEYDAKRNKYIIGAVPQYNIIEMGNFTPTSIFQEDSENEDRTYKNYTDDEIRAIQRYSQFLLEIGAAPRSQNKRSGTATLPTNAYQFRMAVVSSGTSWTKILDTLVTTDKPLFNRCKGSTGEEMNSLLNVFANFDLGTSAKEKKEKLMQLVDKLAEISFYYQSWIPRFGTLPMDLVANPDEAKNLMYFYQDETNAYAFERDDQGKLIYEADLEGMKRKVPRPGLKVGEDYILDKLEQIHTWIAGTLTKMHGYGIYEYGSWKFQSAQHNIILATRDSLAYLGFSSQSREDVQNVVAEITTYKNELAYDSNKVESITYVDEVGEKQVFKRKPQQVLQKQLDLLMGKINVLMTEEGAKGKFILGNLKIDGFVLDEAHIAKKVFTNVKTDSSVTLVDESGKALKINTSTHDIKGVAASDLALRVFAVCQYIRSLGDKKPVMLLTATPFSNQPTEIFTMLSMVGIKQLREQGISNIKNFFDLFLKETLKYDFDHTGEFIKRISVEEFRNKEILLNVIWSVIDIKREANLDKAALLKKEREDSDTEIRPMKIVLPKLVSDTSKEFIETEDTDNDDTGLSECEQFGNINTVAIVNRMSINTSSIVDRNDVQKQMMADIDKVITNTPNPDSPVLDDKGLSVFDPVTKQPLYHAYTFDDICPNAQILAEVADQDSDSEIKEKGKKQADENKTKVSNRDEKGKVFKALGLSRSIALSPYLFPCNTLPEPTPDNLIKYSPKLEYLVKALKSVKEHHTIVIPKKIKDLELVIEKMKGKAKLSNEDKAQLQSDQRKLRHLKSSTDVSGQVAYFNILRFKYYSKDSSGKAQVKEYNIATLIKEYLVKHGIFKAEEVAIYSSDTGKENKENYIKDFQEGKIKVFLGTPSMREGVDLQHKASTLYVMTPDWNSTDMKQVEGRIWRRDNEHKFVRIVYVLLDQSIEVFIYSKLEEKSRRLRQIMKERNTVEEIEEMSLDPNQTKVALASDPVKRADIITKLCETILGEKRNKIARSREELNKVSEKLDEIVEAVEVVRDNYLVPFYEAYPAILQKRIDYQKKEIVETFVNNKEKFVEMFAQKPAKSRITDNTLLLTLNMIYYGESRDRSLNLFRTADMNTIMDILTGYKTILENKELFIGKDSFTDNCDTYMGLNPMMLSVGSYEKNTVMSNLFYTYGISTYRSGEAGFGIKLFEGTRILYMPDDVQKIILKEVSKVVSRQGNISRQNVIDAMDNLADKMVKMLNEYVYSNPLVRPENYQPYVDLTNTNIHVVTTSQFENEDLFGKIRIIKDMQTIIKGQAVSAYMSLTKENREKVRNGQPLEKPSLAELIPILNLQDITKGGSTELDRIIAPISDLSVVMEDVQANFLATRDLKITDLPRLVQDFERDYEDINNKISSLQASREKLIRKFEKVAEERKSVSIDDIVEKFAETNNYLESKMSYGLKD